MFLACAAATGCIGPRHLFGAYHGTVVDSETKAPIEGAVVVVWWEKCMFPQMDGCGTPHSVRETVTGPSGEFWIWAARDPIWNPFDYESPSGRAIVIYAVDYVPLTSRHQSLYGFDPEDGRFEAMVTRGGTIPLRRPGNSLKLRESISIISSGLATVNSAIPESAVPQLSRAIHRQWARWGMWGTTR
jgi:hypothetical protein